MKQICFVAIGGALGSICRYIFSIKVNHSNFPVSTFLINVLGSFFIGLLMGYFSKNPNQYGQMLLVTGFCGGFTTFSTFSFEILYLFQQNKYSTAIIYGLGSLIVGLLFVYLGFYCKKYF